MAVVKEANELQEVVQASGVEQQTATTLLDSFLPFFQQAKEWKEKASTLVVTDVSQTREMKMAREARLALKEIRVNANKTRQSLKEDSIRYGKAVQGVYNVIEYLISPIEKHLQEQEDFAKIQEEKRIAQLTEDRTRDLAPYSEFVPFGIDLGRMSEEDFAKTLNGAKMQHEAKIEAKKKAEAERIAKEKAEAEERERMRVENERLKAEAEERERVAKEREEKAEAERKAAEKKAAEERKAVEAKAAEDRRIAEEKARKEREEYEAKLKAEREEKARIEAELKAQRDKEEAERKAAEAKAAQELKAKQLAEKKAAAAPDKAKLIEFADLVDSLAIPTVKSEEAKAICKNVETLIAKLSNYVRENANKL